MDKQRKLQKFNIRKYTVGTCSILIGTLILLGLPTHDAFASENVIQKHAQEEKAEGKSTDPVEEASAIEESSNVEETKEIGTAETPAEQPQEEATTEAPAVDETTQDTTTNEESTTEEASTEEATKVDTVAPEAAKVETAEKAEQPKAESTEVAKEETTTEAATETAEPAVNTVDAVQPASVEETPAVDTPTVEATVTNTISDVDTSSVSSKSLEDIVNDQNKDKVEATTLEQPSRQAPRSGESYGSVFRAAELQTRNVSNWVEYFRALEDKNVGTINFTQDISMPASTRGPAGAKYNHITLSNNPRAITVNLNGHVFDAKDNFIEVPANGNNQPAWNFTFNNGEIRTASRTNNASGGKNNGIFEFKNGSHDHVLNLRNITHTGGTLINDDKLEVNLLESFTSHNNGESGKDKNITIGANVIRSSENSTINMDMSTKGKIFKVYGSNNNPTNARKYLNGNLSFGHHSTVTLNTSSENPFDEDNAHTIFSTEGDGVRIVLGNDSTINLTGQDIFSYGVGQGLGSDGEYSMLNTGQRTTINIKQKGNGNIINMHGGSVVNIERDAVFNAVSENKLNGDARKNNLIGLNSNSTFNVHENAVFKVDARNHQIDDKGKKGGNNPVMTLPVSGATKSAVILKENSTFDIKSDNPDYHSELIGFGNVGGGNGERGIFIEGTVKYFNLQRTGIVSGGDAGTYFQPTGNVTLIYGDLTKDNVLKWSGNHEVRTWDARQFSGKGMYDSDIDSNVSHIWENISNFSSVVAGKHTKSGSTTVNEGKSTLESNNGLSIKDLDLGRNQRFLLIGNTDAKANDPNYGEEYKETSPGTAAELPITTPENKPLPTNTSFKIPKDATFPTGWKISVDNDGKVTATPPVDAQKGDTVDIPVEITYPDGSKDTATAKVKVVKKDAHEYNPNYDFNPKETKPGKAVDVPQTGDTDLPPGTTYEIPEGANIPEGWTATVNPNTGVVTVTPPANAYPGDKADIPVKVKYPDGSSDDTSVPVKVVSNQANDHTPGYEDTETTPGNTIKLPQKGDSTLPPKTKFEIPNGSVPDGWNVQVDPDTGELTVTTPANANGDEIEPIEVLVNYPVGTSEVTRVAVSVVKPDSEIFEPSYGGEPVHVKRGTSVDIPLTERDYPEGTKFEIPKNDVPTGYTATVDPLTGAVTVTPSSETPVGDKKRHTSFS
ncbi:YPDG domain-containing protein [Mammaliicoccus sciuri]|uniref:YPDG domain-containing protein n=1 Tax=Mammaliicoccus sciuri TaxID=1296 RepID=UPI0004719539|nr:YPDG domain-containing protein [Mammaliicoccus sciuri]